MRVLITGANGFIGKRLVQRLLADDGWSKRIQSLHLLDRSFDTIPSDPRVTVHRGSFDQQDVLTRLTHAGLDLVFHLASLPGGAAEADYDLGLNVNLLGTLALFHQLARMDSCPIVVFASSVAVYGAPLPTSITLATLPKPVISYGTHKLVAETVLEDLSRRGALDGRSLRLPGLVARPYGEAGFRSAFMSDLLWAGSTQQPYDCPVSPAAIAWWMSARCCIDNLLHAADLRSDHLEHVRTFPLPVLHLSIAEIIDALCTLYGSNCRDKIRFTVDQDLEAVFGRFPPLTVPEIEALGFRNDGTAQDLIRHALKT